MKPQIVAMGGGGFATEPENLLLEKYVLSLSGNRTRPRVCFIPTASGDSANYIERFYTSFGELDAVPSHLPLFGLTVRDGVGLHFVGTRLTQVVSSRVNARAYEVRLDGLELIETELLPRYLGR
ncbi:MAG TPA: Type 1 glutamine amidotransferase-like domain-containing protein [Chthoniobacterales bacterium]|jgi:hypothetical protein